MTVFAGIFRQSVAYPGWMSIILLEAARIQRQNLENCGQGIDDRTQDYIEISLVRNGKYLNCQSNYSLFPWINLIASIAGDSGNWFKFLQPVIGRNLQTGSAR